MPAFPGASCKNLPLRVVGGALNNLATPLYVFSCSPECVASKGSASQHGTYHEGNDHSAECFHVQILSTGQANRIFFHFLLLPL